ncbi:histidinol-phosphate transaminase [Paenisporosarcina sp. TG20]|uniref:pyridoxal phosphate-dependent aminotransferase n=1 Tax=Paenisporosarcina sp. TG20 TaxID=1211706 RepID=UPI0002D89190|nr:aminotransferase class I/II-fold pyridoxal phosphate-dependent enzyme [Paenisporosarcina sp. TG20]
MSLPNHGANPHHLYTSLGMAQPKRIIDFSENVNPLGPPYLVQMNWYKLQNLITRYPEPQGEPFRTTAARYHNISPDSIFVANGAAEVFSLLAEKYRGKRAILVHPTFSEYEATLKAHQVDIVNLSMIDLVTGELPIAEIKKHMIDADVIYLCTPNNPTGTLPEHSSLRDLVECAKKSNCDVVLDEAFIDFISEEASFIPFINSGHVLIVRSMTKMYAIPGIRLGYMVAAPQIVTEVQQLAPHWNINGVAAEIGSLVLEDEDYRMRTIQHSTNMRLDMTAFLKVHGCEVSNSQINFLLFKLPQPNIDFFRHLLQKGIVLRHTENFHGLNGQWFRIGMKTQEQLEILKKELKQWFEAH